MLASRLRSTESELEQERTNTQMLRKRVTGYAMRGLPSNQMDTRSTQTDTSGAVKVIEKSGLSRTVSVSPVLERKTIAEMEVKKTSISRVPTIIPKKTGIPPKTPSMVTSDDQKVFKINLSNKIKTVKDQETVKTTSNIVLSKFSISNIKFLD